MNAFESELKRLYPDFDAYPREARLALFDMIFNLGMTKLRLRYQKFNKAVIARDWAQAARESNRVQVQPSRSHYVRDLLNKAAGVAQPATVRAN